LQCSTLTVQLYPSSSITATTDVAPDNCDSMSADVNIPEVATCLKLLQSPTAICRSTQSEKAR
jgi:hypothetical protein